MPDDEAVAAVPPDAQLVKKLLKSMGVSKYEPQVVHQLLNFTYRHVSEILQDAEAYMSRTGNTGEIGMEDVLLSIQSREAFSFMQPPPQSVLTELAARVNKEPLPELSDKPGLVIPVNSLVGPSYQLTVEADDELPSADDGEPVSGDSLRPTKRAKGAPEGKIQIELANENS